VWFDESRDGAVTEYKGYRIEPYEPEPGRWRARISRLDGKELKIQALQADLVEMDAVAAGHRADFEMNMSVPANFWWNC
jgi:hypothetical protein